MKQNDNEKKGKGKSEQCRETNNVRQTGGVLSSYLQGSQLVLGEGLGWEDVEGGGGGGGRVSLLGLRSEEVVEDGRVVADGLAAGCRRGDDHVPPLLHRQDGRLLVRVPATRRKKRDIRKCKVEPKDKKKKVTRARA